MLHAFATDCGPKRFVQATSRGGSARLASLAFCAGVICLSVLPASGARADAMSSVYRGRDLGLPLRTAIYEVQATGSSHAPHTTLSISGSGDQLMFTEVSFDTIEIETATYKDLDFDTVVVRKIGDMGGRYGITLPAAAGSVNDHIVGTGKAAAAAADHDSPLGYMDFWLVDPDMSRIRHLADLLATIGARLKEQGGAATPVADAGHSAGAPAVPSPAVSRSAADVHVDEAPEVAVERANLPAQHASPLVEAVVSGDSDRDPIPTGGKCLFSAAKKQKHSKQRTAASDWSNLTQGMTSPSGRIAYRISALHGADDHQSIQFFLGNALPVRGTVVARVILTSSNGSQQAEDIGLNGLPGHSIKTDESLRLTPFEDASCITDIDITEVHACPLPADDTDAEDSVAIFHCSEDAAAGTTTVNGITYVSGREPKMLTAPTRAAGGSTSVTSMASLAATGSTAQAAAQGH